MLPESFRDDKLKTEVFSLFFHIKKCCLNAVNCQNKEELIGQNLIKN